MNVSSSTPNPYGGPLGAALAPGARAARPALAAAAPAPLSAAEEAQIAGAFPPRPAVAQTLYGPGRQVHQPPQVGTRLDLSA
jgi:hypothetical protein